MRTHGLRSWIAPAMALMVAVFGLGTLMIRSDRQVAANEASTYHTAIGERATIHLRDGSTMILAPATTVTITAQGLKMSGEAYFTVAAHTASPFAVTTRNAMIRVLGTRFVVRQYPDEPNSRVMVEEGRVTLQTLRPSTPNNARVIASRMLAFVTDSGITVSSGIATLQYTGWTEGNLVFEGASLHDVVAELARAYGVQIKIADTTLAKQVVGIEVSLAKDPLGQVLGSLCNVTDAHYTRDGRMYVLSPGRVATKPLPVAPLRHSFPLPEQQYGR